MLTVYYLVVLAYKAQVAIAHFSNPSNLRQNGGGKPAKYVSVYSLENYNTEELVSNTDDLLLVTNESRAKKFFSKHQGACRWRKTSQPM